MTAMATRICREQVTAMMHAHDISPTLEVCIVIDNSGSMAPIATQCIEGLVMLMEVLKELAERAALSATHRYFRSVM
jgi:hypothetical protein